MSGTDVKDPELGRDIPTSGTDVKVHGPATPNPSSGMEHAIKLPTAPLTIQQFRMLLGIPSTNPHPTSTDPALAGEPDPGLIPRISSLPRWLSRKPEDPEAPTSIYYALVREERATWHRFYLYDWIVYGSLIAQLVISALLIVFGALKGGWHISIEVLGAVNGVITGILSLIRGQGLPNRLLQYADGLRRVREDIEFLDREIRGGRKVTWKEVEDMRMNYETVRADTQRNDPDVWSSTLPAQVGSMGNMNGKNPGR
ncbi:hypothetical protein EJ06DRAFT_532802 [Trichodelitschia bisporula]|uniref:SMODS and SLOG-associating 2TM effector domain-containing protein n=1 Tax=Trichodelitschia bisporula TaxID=703511 RepID=A0A6G1HPN0_9PEZI|nr:hypothetical protein EJ06DRAFT_532802 [Trichodelitschia bisporula]